MQATRQGGSIGIVTDLFMLAGGQNIFINTMTKRILIDAEYLEETRIVVTNESDIEDLPWYRNKIMWKEYLDMLVTNRFNRFTFTLGMQYNYPYGNEFISDVYFYLAYPFLVQPKGYIG